MDVLGGLTSSFSSLIPIIAVVGIGALLQAKGVDSFGNMLNFANDAAGNFLGLIDGLGGNPQEQAQEQEQVVAATDLGEAQGKEHTEAELEQIKGIKNVLMHAGVGDTPETILSKVETELNLDLTDEERQKSLGIINDVYNDMLQNANIFKLGTNMEYREQQVDLAITKAEQKGLFDVIGEQKSIADQTVSQETAEAAAPQTESPAKNKTQEKTQDKQVENNEPER